MINCWESDFIVSLLWPKLDAASKAARIASPSATNGEFTKWIVSECDETSSDWFLKKHHPKPADLQSPLHTASVLQVISLASCLGFDMVDRRFLGDFSDCAPFHSLASVMALIRVSPVEHFLSLNMMLFLAFHRFQQIQGGSVAPTNPIGGRHCCGLIAFQAASKLKANLFMS